MLCAAETGLQAPYGSVPTTVRQASSNLALMGLSSPTKRIRVREELVVVLGFGLTTPPL